MASYSTRIKSQGFTLLEVLIAIAIFAVISLASFSIFDTVLTSDERSQERTARINELQRAFIIIERDFLQIARRTIRFNGEKPLEAFIHLGSQNFDTNEQAIGFVRHGWSNPGLLLPRSDMQSVAYQLKDNILERLHFNFVDPVLGEEPKVRPLIHQVKNVTFEFYDGKKWQKDFKKDSLPMAAAIEIDLDDYGLIRREFLLAGDNLPDQRVN